MLYLLIDTLRERLIDLGIWWMFMIFDQLTFRALAAALLSFLIVLIFGKGFIDWLRRKKIGDTGSTDAEALRRAATSKANTPTMGGALIGAAVLASVLLLADIGKSYVVTGLIVFVFLGLLGAADDWLKLTAASRGGSRQGLYSREKLLFQLGLAFLISLFLYNHGSTSADTNMAHVLNLPFQGTYRWIGDGQVAVVNEALWYIPRWLFVLYGTLLIAGMSNAVNISDGMDGLATGMTAIVGLGLVVLAFIAGSESTAKLLLVPHITYSEELVVLAAAIVGACVGFLWWNCSPAAVFMGDTGSLALGGTIAYIALVVRQEFLLLLMCGVILAEIGSVVLQVGYFKYTRRKTGTGVRLFRVAPIHHHFHVMGWTEQQVVVRFWIVTAILVVMSLALVKLR